jgi:SAM-dependent methyltransferase
VVATDLDTRFLERIKASNLEILQHNAVTDHFGEDVYDLVHSRDVLEHIPERELVLDKMVAALKPGGWLVAEDADFTAGLRAEGFAEMNECTELEGRMWQPIVKAMSARGIDAEYGRRLPWRLAARGLTDIDADIRAPLGKAGSPMARLNALSIHQLRPLFLEGGMMEEEVERLIAYVEGDDFMGYGPLHIAAWGRKPA